MIIPLPDGTADDSELTAEWNGGEGESRTPKQRSILLCLATLFVLFFRPNVCRTIEESEEDVQGMLRHRWVTQYETCDFTELYAKYTTV